MAALRLFFALLALSARAFTASISLRADDDVTLNLEPQLTGGFVMVLVQDDQRTVYGHIGRTLITTSYTMEDIEGGNLIRLGANNLTVQTVFDEANSARGIKIKWNGGPLTRFEDCIDFGSKHWYAGPMQVDQIYPVENARQEYAAYYSRQVDNGAVIERYWLNSAGEYIYVDSHVPLFVDYHNLQNNHICFGAQISDPYSTRRNHTELAYDIWFLNDAKAAHKHAVANYLGKPTGVPDFRMVQYPIWSTWAQYSQDISHERLLEYAQQIVAHEFENSQFEIDDLWEICYGSLIIDERKFPNFTQTIQDIKDLGFRVSIWLHPFINRNCEPLYSEALNNGYFVVNEAGSAETSWWNNNGSTTSHVDFNNPAAAEWWYQRVKTFIDTYNIDSIKFDAGESTFSPQIAVQNGDIDYQPHHIVRDYVRTCARFGDMIEVSAAFRTQDLPIFVRMVDRDSIWGLNNGLSTIITTGIQMNLNGYPFVLPDMIGGNGFNLDHPQADLPTKELFIRWVQANTFWPTMQYSFAPWNFDNEVFGRETKTDKPDIVVNGSLTVEISRKYTELHATYAEEIYDAMKAAVEDGSPVNRPLWWLDPHDEDALRIWDEYLLGDRILVAPVVQEGAVTRDIYLPAGTWYEEGDLEREHVGPVWLRNHPAPIDVLPYFVRLQVADDASTTSVAAFLLLSAMFAHILVV